MPDKPQKFGFLEYALCTMNGYFLCVVVHHVPGKQKRKQRGLDEINIDEEWLLQLRLQKRYGVQGALVMRLVGMLNNHGHHIIGDNAFSSAQLALDLKRGDNKLFHITKCNYTGIQKMKLNKKEGARPLSFVEYRNLPHN